MERRQRIYVYRNGKFKGCRERYNSRKKREYKRSLTTSLDGLLDEVISLI